MNIEEFLKAVSTHEMSVLQDDGVRRHIRFSRPGTNCMWFDLVTWPGHLCYTGDMGTFVFSRTVDMFEFFKSDDGRISPNYWAEKLLAEDTHGGAHEWDAERFERVIKEYRREWMREIKGKEDRRRIFDEVTDEVLSMIPDGEHVAYQAAHEFVGRADGNRYEFHDLWDHNFKKRSRAFLWACHAIVWGIQKYEMAAARNSLPELAG